MKINCKVIFTLLMFVMVLSDVFPQIVINGHYSRRYLSSISRNAISISYGNILWIDGENVPLAGHSYSREAFPSVGNFENRNISTGINVGYEKTISARFGIRTSFSTAKLTTGLTERADLIAHDKSRFTQLGLYSRYTLTKDLRRRFQFQWLAGPELIYARKNVLIEDYVEGEEAPHPYRQDISIIEGAVVTGLGISFRVSDAFCLFSDGMVGISLPGKGLKVNNSGFGIKYTW